MSYFHCYKAKPDPFSMQGTYQLEIMSKHKTLNSIMLFVKEHDLRDIKQFNDESDKESGYTNAKVPINFANG